MSTVTTVPITCPSGRVVHVKRPGVYETFRLTGMFPDVATEGLTEEEIEKAIETASSKNRATPEQVAKSIRFVLDCCVEPKFFADLRTDEEARREGRRLANRR